MFMQKEMDRQDNPFGISGVDEQVAEGMMEYLLREGVGSAGHMEVQKECKDVAMEGEGKGKGR